MTVDIDQIAEPADTRAPECDEGTVSTGVDLSNVAVVIASRSRPAACEAAWRSVVREIPEAQLVVVEQVEPGGEYPIGGDFPGVWLRQQGTGVSRARNLGLQFVDREIVVFLDDDAVVLPDIRRLLAFHAAGDGGDVTCGVIHFHGTELDPNDERAEILPHRIGRLFIESSAVWNAADIRAAGGFDERFGVGTQFGAEEGPVLLSRLQALGRNRFVYEPIVGFSHPPVSTASSAKSFSYGRGMGALMMLSPSWWLARYIGFTVVRSLLGIVALTARGAFGDAATRVSRLRGFAAGSCDAFAVRFLGRVQRSPAGGGYERMA